MRTWLHIFLFYLFIYLFLLLFSGTQLRICVQVATPLVTWEIPWDAAVLSANESCKDKLAAKTIMPVRSVKVHQTDRPWLNADLKRLLQKRQQALSSADASLFKLLKNKVNRERKRCRAIYYNNKMRDFKGYAPSRLVAC